MQLNHNLLEMARKVCVIPTQSSSSRSKAPKESSAAAPAFPCSRIQLSRAPHRQSSPGLSPDAALGWGNLFGFCCRTVATGSKNLKARC